MLDLSIKKLAWIYIWLNIADATYTIWFVTNRLGFENNTMLAYLISQSPILFVVFKVIMASLLAIFAIKMHVRGEKWAKNGLTTAVFLQTAILIWNYKEGLKCVGLL